MDNERVTSRLSDNEGGGGNTDRLICYTNIFKRLCPFYLSIGVRYEDYWNGDPEIARYYREAYSLKQDRINFEQWLNGLYIYNALLSASPVFNPMHKTHKPEKYIEEPIPITKNAQREKEREQYEDMKQRMTDFLMDYNRRRGEKRNGNRT